MILAYLCIQDMCVYLVLLRMLCCIHRTVNSTVRTISIQIIQRTIRFLSYIYHFHYIIDVKTLYGVECVKEKQQIDLVIKLEDWKKDADFHYIIRNQTMSAADQFQSRLAFSD